MASLGAVGGASAISAYQTAAQTKHASDKAEWNASTTAIHAGHEGNPTQRKSGDAPDETLAPTEHLHDVNGESVPGSPGLSIVSSVPATPVSQFGFTNPHDTAHGMDPAASTASITAIRHGTEGGHGLISPLGRSVASESAYSTPAASLRPAPSTGNVTPVPPVPEHESEDKLDGPETPKEAAVVETEATPAKTAEAEPQTKNREAHVYMPAAVVPAERAEEKGPPTPPKDTIPIAAPHEAPRDGFPATASATAALATMAAGGVAATAASTGSASVSAFNTPAESPGLGSMPGGMPTEPVRQRESRESKEAKGPTSPPTSPLDSKTSPTSARIPVPSLDPTQTARKSPKPGRVPVPKLAELAGDNLPDLAPGRKDEQVGSPASRNSPGCTRAPGTYPTPQWEGAAETRSDLRAGDMSDPKPAAVALDARHTPIGTPRTHTPARSQSVHEAASPVSPARLAHATSVHGSLSAMRAKEDMEVIGGPGVRVGAESPGARTSTSSGNVFLTASSSGAGSPEPWRPEPGYQGVSGLGIENRPVRTRSRSGSAFGMARAVVTSAGSAITSGTKTAGSAISAGTKTASSAISSGVRNVSINGKNKDQDKDKEARTMSALALSTSTGTQGTTGTTGTAGTAGTASAGSSPVREQHQTHQRSVSSTSTASSRLKKLGLLTKLKGEMKVIGDKINEAQAKKKDKSTATAEK